MLNSGAGYWITCRNCEARVEVCVTEKAAYQAAEAAGWLRAGYYYDYYLCPTCRTKKGVYMADRNW